MSPLTLRKRYLPRRRDGPEPHPAHPAAKAAAAAAQAQPPDFNKRHQSKTETFTTSNRCTRITLTRFKPGFEQDTEKEMATIFKRPIRTYKEDPPFYPWLPSPVPLVNFHLNFKG